MNRLGIIFAVMLVVLPSGLWGQEESGRKSNEPHLQLSAAIDAVLAQGDLAQGTIGIHVEDLSTGEVLYGRNSDRLMNPASNMKLLTAAAVLERLGPFYVVTTELQTNRREGSRIGELFVTGGGEAFLLHRDILAWASELRQQGIERIEGDVVIDDSLFGGAYLPPGYDLRPSDASWRSLIGAISVNFNAVEATVGPGSEVGAAARVRMDPPNDHIVVDNRARTVRGSLGRIWVTAEPYGDTTRLIVTGTIGVNADPVSMRKRIDNPPAFAGAVIATAMEEMGIELQGEVRQGEAPENLETLYVHESRPMYDAVAAMNKWSNNFMAEQMLRFLGVDRSGEIASTWEDSIRVATQTLQQAELIGGPFTLYNGSGLYDGNLVSPRQFVELLREMRAHRYGPEFMSSLAIAGVDGTLRHRLDSEATRGNLRGKTGSLRNVAALSGYVQTRSGRMVAFSILFNDPPRPAWSYRNQQDQVAEAIADLAD